MKTITNIGAQGDVIFRRIDNLPETAEALPENNEYIVAHSETGHHHVARGKKLRHHRDTENPLKSYLEFFGSAEVEHLRSFDTHETVELLGKIDEELKRNKSLKGAAENTYYEVIRQRQATPQGWERVVD